MALQAYEEEVAKAEENSDDDEDSDDVDADKDAADVDDDKDAEIDNDEGEMDSMHAIVVLLYSLFLHLTCHDRLVTRNVKFKCGGDVFLSNCCW